MRLVPKPVTRPGHCAVLPYIGQTAQDEKWVDTGSELPGFDNHVYVSATAVREMASLLGYPTASSYDKVSKDLKAALKMIDEMTAQVEESFALEQAIDLVRSKVKVAA
jgi:hypothetical protein